MTGSPPRLGDSHNFGRFVTMRDGRVHKPRTLLWEWLLLSDESPLRCALSDHAARAGLDDDAFAFLPSLRFTSHDAREGGTVEHVDRVLSPLSGPATAARRTAIARAFGRACALFSWLGLADLHWENLALGLDARGHVVFAPLDVEIILSDLALPSETKLLPDADPEIVEIARHAAGARRVLPYLGKPVHPVDLVAMAAAYHRMIVFLDAHAGALAAVLSRVVAIRSAPIRVLLRGTGDYVRALSDPPWPPLLDAELEQLARGDIPYFFRVYGRAGIYRYVDASLAKTRRLPLAGDVPRLSPLLSLARAFQSPRRASLRDHGLFALLAAFDHPSFSGDHHDEDLSVGFRAKSFAITLPDGDHLSTRRDLHTVVGSVYLPCTCGEVRSVLVPSKTVCRTPASRQRARVRGV